MKIPNSIIEWKNNLHENNIIYAYDIIDNFINTFNLSNGKGLLKKHLKMLSAYMNVTALEGDPSILDRFKVWYLRNFKEIRIEKRLYAPKYKKIIFEVVKFTLTIGLSGFLTYFVSNCNQSQKDNTELFKKLEQI